MKPVLGILLEFGFHEIKKFIHSGFVDKAARKFDIIWFYIDKGSPEFESYFRETGFPLIKIDEDQLPKGLSQLEARNHNVRRSWLVNKRLGAFHNYSVVNRRSLKSLLKGNDLVKLYFEKRALTEVKKRYIVAYLADLFAEHKVEHFLGTGYSSSFSKSAFVTAANDGIMTWYLVSSWKDLYVNNFIPFNSVNGVFLWSDEMKEKYQIHMPYLSGSKLLVTGNPTFDSLLRHVPRYPRKYYADKYGIKESAKWVIYSMMPPGINNDEIETVKLLSDEVGNHYSDEEVVILLRRNPNHDREDFSDLDFASNLVLTKHYCTYDKEKDLIIQSKEGEQEWLDLLFYVDLNMSIPSTVTLEFLTLGKPVLNIGFGPDGKFNELARQHFDAGFYRDLFSSNPLVHKVMNILELMSKFDQCLEIASANKVEKSPDEINFATDKVIEAIH